jgi:hypothetical protein
MGKRANHLSSGRSERKDRSQIHGEGELRQDTTAIVSNSWTPSPRNIVRRISDRRRRREETLAKKSSQQSAENIFTNADVYAYERELAKLHPDNRHIKDKIRQKLQVLRDLGILS